MNYVMRVLVVIFMGAAWHSLFLLATRPDSEMPFTQHSPDPATPGAGGWKYRRRPSSSASAPGVRCSTKSTVLICLGKHDSLSQHGFFARSGRAVHTRRVVAEAPK